MWSNASDHLPVFSAALICRKLPFIATQTTSRRSKTLKFDAETVVQLGQRKSLNFRDDLRVSHTPIRLFEIFIDEVD